MILQHTKKYFYKLLTPLRIATLTLTVSISTLNWQHGANELPFQIQFSSTNDVSFYFHVPTHTRSSVYTYPYKCTSTAKLHGNNKQAFVQHWTEKSIACKQQTARNCNQHNANKRANQMPKKLHRTVTE